MSLLHGFSGRLQIWQQALQLLFILLYARFLAQLLVVLDILLHSEDDLFEHFFELFHLLITHVLFLVEPCLERVESCIVETCGLNEHLRPALILILRYLLLLPHVIQ